MKKIKGMQIDVTTGMANIITINDTLEELYRVTNCDMIDITARHIGGHKYAIVCDDEGLLKDKPMPSAFDADGNCALVGNLFICNNDYKGELESLTQDDIRIIQQHLTAYFYDDPATHKSRMVAVVRLSE